MIPGSRWPLPVLAVLLLACTAPAPAKAASAATPGCDAISGATIARNATWRIVRLPIAGLMRARVVACRVRDVRDAPVRVLGESERLLGATFNVDQLVGSSAIVSIYGEDGDFWVTRNVRLLDLARGASRRLGGSSIPSAVADDDAPGHRTLTVLTAAGGLATTSWRGRIADPYYDTVPPSPLLALGKTGPVSLGRRVDTIEPAPTGSAVYIDADERAPERVRVPGPVPRSYLRPDATLRWQRPRLAAHHDTALIRELAGDHRRDGYDLVRLNDGSAAIRHTDGGKPTEPVRLAPGGEDELRVLASGDDLVVAGRFDDVPQRREISVLGTLGSPKSPRLPATPETERPGQVAEGWGGVAVAVADGLWILPSVASFEPTWIARPGLHDLAVVGWTVYATDPDGRAVSVPLVVPDA